MPPLSYDEAVNAFDALTADATDDAIAAAAADYLLVQYNEKKTFHLAIFHDEGPRAAARVAKLKEKIPSYEPQIRVGRCPMPHDWKNKGMLGISTKDVERARQWIIDAMMYQYAVYLCTSRNGGGGGPGTIKTIRKRLSERGEV
jgi:hypothetical protein